MEQIINNTKHKLESTIRVLHENLSTIIATGAHSSMLKNIEVEYYEVMTPLTQIANIKVKDATMLIVTAFDITINKNIIEAIHKSELDLNPVDEGNSIRIMVPLMTAEKRNFFVKEAKIIGEDSRISVRNVRMDANKKIKNSNFSENEERLCETEIQKIVDNSNKEIEEIIKAKISSLTNI